MTQRLLPLILVAMLVIGTFLPPASGQDDNESPGHYPGVWYKIVVDGKGDYIDGEGDGDGWYYYPESDVYRMWFYNGPYDPARKGFLDYHVYSKAVDPTKQSYVLAYFGWTTPEWSSLKQSGPPTADDMPTLNDEARYMSGARIYEVSGVIPGTAETIRSHSVEGYNPEWICIEIRARNAYIYRGAFHECTPKGSQMGACCNRQTGYCYLSSESDCAAPMVWLGAGATCDQCTREGSVGTDFGDAPDRGYLTLLASNGARHSIVAGVFLGGAVDGEPDGQPNSTATGDQNNGMDEDGVVFTSTVNAGQEATIEITASTGGYLNAWVDFDADGQFDNGRDRIFADRLLTRGINRLSFTVPANAAAGWTFARFRFNTRGLLDSFGPAEDGEVEDYCVQIVASHDARMVSGASRLAWSQPPSPASDGETQVFQAGGVVSALHRHEIVADDWQPAADEPITGVHWWGIFDGWTESYMPRGVPLAFHIGIWTDVPDPQPYNFDTFAHPGTLVWETYCTNWAWAVAGAETLDDAGRPGATCFLFSHLLSQDQWFEISRAATAQSESKSRVYWLSISALYDPSADEPAHMWMWKTRASASDAGAASLKTIVSPSKASSWPPTLGAQWETGTTLRDRRFSPIDMAFQLTTFAPLELKGSSPTGVKAAGTFEHTELAMLAAGWLDAMR